MTGAEDDQNNSESSEILNNCKKLCGALQSENKVIRYKSLKELKIFLVESKCSQEEYHVIFRNCHIQLLNTLRDQSEPVREQSIEFMHILLFDLLPFNDFYLSYLFPIFVERIGSVEIIEESEEIRLLLLQLIEAILRNYPSEQLKVFINDLIVIFKETVQDKHPMIKEVTCKSIVKMTEKLPKEFHLQGENLVKNVLTTFSHQRYKVRVEGIKCIGQIVMHSNYKAMEESVTPLAERLFDQIAKVRQTVTEVVGLWLKEYKDRYSFFHKLLPLVLTLLNDEVQETRDRALQIWLEVGLQYQKENEEDLKEQLDFLYEKPKYYPEDLIRPNLGCRCLVQRNVGKLTAALAKELQSWQEDVRVRCAQLLCAVALHSEEYLTQHLQDLLMPMYSAAKDEDKRVSDNIVRATEIMALFVPPETWTKLLFPLLESGPHYGHLIILGAFIRKTPWEFLKKYLLDIAKILSDPPLLYSRKMKFQKEIINCVQAIQEKHANFENCSEELGEHLFCIIITVISIRDPENDFINENLLVQLQNSCGLSSQYELWRKYLGKILNLIGNDPKSWTESSFERCIFDSVLLMSREAFGEHLPTIGQICIDALEKDVEPEARLKTFMSLSQALEFKDLIFAKATTKVEDFLAKLISEIFVPSLIWKAGRTAEALRTVSVACLCSALNPGLQVDIFGSAEVLRPLVDQLAPLLISLLEDAAYRSRYLALEALVLLKDNLVQKNNWKIEDLIKFYPEILKRLDDPTDKVRNCALKAMKMILEDAPKEFNSVTFRAHIEMIINTLVTHYDEEDEKIQALVFDAFMVLAKINSVILKEKIEQHKPLVRNKIGCEKIIESLENLRL